MRLNEPGLRQLKQRITLRCEIAPFTLNETAAYLAQRIKTAGGEAARLFTREAVMAIHQRSAGIARTVSVIADNALLTAFGMGRKPVDRHMVQEVARDLDLLDAHAAYAAHAAHAVEADDDVPARESAEPGARAGNREEGPGVVAFAARRVSQS